MTVPSTVDWIGSSAFGHSLRPTEALPIATEKYRWTNGFFSQHSDVALVVTPSGPTIRLLKRVPNLYIHNNNVHPSHPCTLRRPSHRSVGILRASPKLPDGKHTFSKRDEWRQDRLGRLQCCIVVARNLQDYPQRKLVCSHFRSRIAASQQACAPPRCKAEWRRFEPLRAG